MGELCKDLCPEFKSNSPYPSTFTPPPPPHPRKEICIWFFLPGSSRGADHLPDPTSFCGFKAFVFKTPVKKNDSWKSNRASVVCLFSLPSLRFWINAHIWASTSACPWYTAAVVKCKTMTMAMKGAQSWGPGLSQSLWALCLLHPETTGPCPKSGGSPLFGLMKIKTGLREIGKAQRN